MTQDLSTFLDAARQAADAAAEIIRANRQKPESVDYKGVIDLVTDTDGQRERAIVERIARQFPEHSILAEGEPPVGAARKFVPADRRSACRHDRLRPWLSALLCLGRSGPGR